MAAILDAKAFLDPVHGLIKIPKLCVDMINTPQLQRLRHIKQMGGVDHVYPGAYHHRLEHSIGTCYVAGVMCRHLQANQRDLGITESDILCVMIAGLCHDLGHGPFSHMFDGRFIPEARLKARQKARLEAVPEEEPKEKWKHEKASRDMFDYMLDDNDLRQVFCNKEYGLEEIDITFIKEMILGVELTVKEGKEWDEKQKGREKEKSFFFQIISNKSNGLNVDKFDYFARDCYHLGFNSTFDYQRLIEFCRVLKVDGFNQICFRDKVSMNLYDMYHVHTTLHRRACKHRVTQVVEIMICEALMKADKYLEIEGKDEEGNKKMRSISESIDDMVAYTRVTDNLVHEIRWSSDPKLKEAKDLLIRIEKRDLYSFVLQSRPKPGEPLQKDDKDTYKGEIAIIEIDGCENIPLLENQLELDIINLDYGKDDKNPIEGVRFYTKEDNDFPMKIKKEEVSGMLPKIFSEQQVRLYCKEKKYIDIATKKFKVWCHNNKMTTPKKVDSSEIEYFQCKGSIL